MSISNPILKIENGITHLQFYSGRMRDLNLPQSSVFIAKDCVFSGGNQIWPKCRSYKLEGCWISLQGLPDTIDGDLTLINCKLPTQLKYCPKHVNGVFMLIGCKDLTSLENGPEYVGEDYVCNFCSITSLKGLAYYIGGDLICNGNDMNYARLYKELLIEHRPTTWDSIKVETYDRKLG